MHFENCADIDGFLKLGHIYRFIKGGAPVYGVGICAPQKLKHFAEQNILNGLDHIAFYVHYIDQELYRSIKVTIMPADYYYLIKNSQAVKKGAAPKRPW